MRHSGDTPGCQCDETYSSDKAHLERVKRIALGHHDIDLEETVLIGRVDRTRERSNQVKWRFSV